MKKFLIAILFLSAFPSITMAQQASSCVDLKNNMLRGAKNANTNNEVTVLQNFLKTRGFLIATPNGSFGPATLTAVKKFQSSVGIGSQGTPGYGGVGPKSRAKIKEMTCGGKTAAVSVANLSTPTNTVNTSSFFSTKSPEVTPTPIITPASTPISITQRGFLLNGPLCSMDYTLVPQSEGNARRLLELCERIVPALEAKFGRGPSAPPYKIQFYTPTLGGQGTGGNARAYAAGSDVFLSTDPWATGSTDSWRAESPYDTQILAHELTHVAQSFKGYLTPEYPGWLVEALADYGANVAGYSNDNNCYHYSNSRQIHVFNCTYKFLKFMERKYDPQISFKLHKALQSETYSENLFVQYTGKNYDQLISECSQDLECGGVDPL